MLFCKGHTCGITCTGFQRNEWPTGFSRQFLTCPNWPTVLLLCREQMKLQLTQPQLHHRNKTKIAEFWKFVQNLSLLVKLEKMRLLWWWAGVSAVSIKQDILNMYLWNLSTNRTDLIQHSSEKSCFGSLHIHFTPSLCWCGIMFVLKLFFQTELSLLLWKLCVSLMFWKPNPWTKSYNHSVTN